MTVCFLIENGKVLLGMKKRGFGEGRWNGFGGKLKDGETIFDAAHRELKEEVGITVNALEERGYIIFNNADRPSFKVHIFVANKHQGTPRESEEMRPQWFDLKKVPYNEMWPGDAIWFPHTLVGEKIIGEFVFDKDDKVISHKINIQ